MCFFIPQTLNFLFFRSLHFKQNCNRYMAKTCWKMTYTSTINTFNAFLLNNCRHLALIDTMYLWMKFWRMFAYVRIASWRYSCTVSWAGRARILRFNSSHKCYLGLWFGPLAGQSSTLSTLTLLLVIMFIVPLATNYRKWVSRDITRDIYLALERILQL